ncbi:hypothetical protein K493DRAFT_311201 [Basidiobolus meristosporus CBS 931.73]|uniref:Membrane-associated proteins in eicosanoid and glutathione metabolism n=1 Tax=Basidiobolus meristosporus CBS 931.73 TaxID=1314790 RepID=A0A1Y1Z3G1_9FUNG|nr:hypothetical protein K493DRAFT_311201 [Basidiobolus meristosporus CBS 931.73]|eukprot:ORY04808.1 hypothetical protein K493DRAFT_311201 [Basidiobolus meristosporus CBS 931.73]
MSIVITPKYSWCVIAAVGMGFQLLLTGGAVAAARKKYNVPYPDMGNGRLSTKLTDEEWTSFNNVQRTHQNYVEQISTAQSLVLLGGLYFPEVSATLGAIYILGRAIYTEGYKRVGPRGRIYGVIPIDLSLLGLVGVTLFGAAKTLKLIK